MVGLRGGNTVGLIAAGLLACAVGCGDISLDAAGSDTDDDASSDDFNTGGSSDTDAGGVDTNGPAESTGLTADPSTSGGDSTGAAPEGSGDEDACDLDCGEGYCDDAADGGPTCVCPDDHVSTGLACIRCDIVEGGQLPADVPAIRARFTLTVDGTTPPDTPYETADIRLRNRVTGDELHVGRTHQANADVKVIPGTYDVVYSHRVGSLLPVNEGAILETIDILGEDVDYTIDVPTASIGGALTFGDGELDDPAYNYGRVWAVKASGDRALLGDTRDGEYSARVIPGSYDLHYENRQSSGSAPLNTDASFTRIDVDARREGEDAQQQIHVDVPFVRFTGAVLIDGVAVTDPYEGGLLDVIDTATGDRFNLADTRDGSFSTRLLPGSYQVVYSSKFGGAVAPVNKGAVLETISLDGDLDHAISINTVQFSGAVTVANNVPPGSTSDDGILSLRGTSSPDDVAVLGNTHDAAFSRRVLVGEYEVFYSQETAGVAMPVNTQASLGYTLDLQEDLVDPINVPVIEVSGALTIDGAPAPDSPYDDGRLYLRNADSGDSVLLGNTRLGTYAARIVPGTYDVVYVNEFSDSVLPLNRGAVVREDIQLAESSNLPIDITVANLSGQITVQGGAASVDDGLGQLFLLDPKTSDAIFLGHTGAPSFEKPLMGGRYIMEYRAVAGEDGTVGDSLPANAKASFACFDVLAQ